MNTSYHDTRPLTYEPVGNGSHLYRWGVEEVAAPPVSDAAADESDAPRTQWRCREVTVWEPVTREKLTAAVLAELWASDYEAKLVNDYNAAKEGFFGEDSQKYIDRYMAFLDERKSIKEQVAADCAELSIA